VETYALVAEEAPAPQPGGPQGQPGGGTLQTVILLVLLFGVFYFLLIRPQRKRERERQKQHEEMLKNLKKSDHVQTIGGIRGVVSSVGEDEVVLKVDEKSDVRIRIVRDAISKVIEAEDKGAEEPK